MYSRSPFSVALLRPGSNSCIGLSEEQITEIFNSVGKVEKFRLVYDSESGRPKGFGFAEYLDPGSSQPCGTVAQDRTTVPRDLISH